MDLSVLFNTRSPKLFRNSTAVCFFTAAAIFFCTPLPVSAAQSKVPTLSATVDEMPVAVPPQEPFSLIIQKARTKAERTYKPTEMQVPDFVQALTETQWRALAFKPDQSPWYRLNTPFDIAFFHPGFIYNRQVNMHAINDGHISALTFQPEMFTYSNKSLQDKVRESVPGFAGLQIIYPLNDNSSRDPIASFLGASYFRGAGRHAQKGILSRALALNTALSNGEEFPYFQEFWIEPPKPEDKHVTLFALLDSPSLTGAYRFAITPGTSTIMDVEARIFLRKGAIWPQKIGMAPLTSMFLYSEMDNGRSGDYRPEVHNSDGLLFSAGENNWSWMPLTNPGRLEISSISTESLRGFGLLQRDNVFDHYQDIANRFDQRSSVWVEPQGDWGAGKIELIQIPSTEEIHDNITAFWVPDTLAPEGGQPPLALSFAYKLYWMTPGVTPHALGKVAATRLVKSQDTARFFIDFESETLKSLPADVGLTSLVVAPENAPITRKQLVKNPATGGWRLSFSVKLPRQDSVVQSIITARDGSPSLRFRALLKRGENLPDPLTEEWVYDLSL